MQLGGDLTRHLPAPGATLARRGWLDSRGPRGRGRRERWGCPCHLCTKAARLGQRAAGTDSQESLC